jgi:hypothetical protein
MKPLNFLRTNTLLLILLSAGALPTPVYADVGVIVLMTRKCFIINTNSGYVIVDGSVSANKDDTIIGDFNTYGSTKIFNTSGQDISGYIYIEERGLSKSRLQDKWDDKYRDKCT